MTSIYDLMNEDWTERTSKMKLDFTVVDNTHSWRDLPIRSQTASLGHWPCRCSPPWRRWPSLLQESTGSCWPCPRGRPSETASGSSRTGSCCVQSTGSCGEQDGISGLSGDVAGAKTCSNFQVKEIIIHCAFVIIRRFVKGKGSHFLWEVSIISKTIKIS